MRYVLQLTHGCLDGQLCLHSMTISYGLTLNTMQASERAERNVHADQLFYVRESVRQSCCPRAWRNDASRQELCISCKSRHFMQRMPLTL